MTDKNTKIYLVCGSGGVGKTTSSASLGLKFAKQGKKVIVLTIDPALRLATALGIDSLSDKPQQIKVKGINTGGEFWAMMLDTKRTFDRLVDKYASSKEARDRIFHNTLYQHLSKMLAGTQEYMAMERLYEIDSENKYDVIIVDTPPMQNAVDFLAAPLKMMNVINNSMLHILLKPAMSLGKKGMGLLEKGSRQILKIFDRITGFAFMQELSEMLIAFQDLLKGFESRASEVDALLKRETTHFVLVGVASDHSLDEINKFSNELKNRGYRLGSVIINKVFVGDVLSSKKIKEKAKELEAFLGKEESDLVVENYLKFIPLIKKDKQKIKEIKSCLGIKLVYSIPLFLSDVHDLEGLNKMSELLGAV